MQKSERSPAPPDGLNRRERRMIQRERIVASALELARTEGAAALSMRRLAEVCAVDPKVMYRLFVDKDGLLLAVYDRMQAMCLERVALLPDDAGWREVLRGLAEAVWEVHTAYPAIAALTFSRTTGSPGERQGAEMILSRLLRAGLGARQAVLYQRVFVDTMLSLAGMEATERASEPGIRERNSAAWRSVHADLLRAGEREGGPAAAEGGSAPSSREIYLASLDAVLDRIERIALG